MKKKTIIISAGGTGGHIFPAISIAEEIQKRNHNVEIIFFGALGKMEMERVPKAGYKIIGLPIRGLSRKFSFSLFSFPILFSFSLFKAFFLILKLRPLVIIGTGGFASSPALFAGILLRKKVFIHEQNSFPGIVNKKIGAYAKKVFVSYPNMEKYFPKNKVIFSGNPLRKIFDTLPKREEAKLFFQLPQEKKTILFIGGSQGARAINMEILRSIKRIEKGEFTFLWQTGKHSFLEAKKHESKTLRVLEFIAEMDMAYSAADVIISRAGALAISEICLVGKPAIFVPLPSAAENHQELNARMLERKNAALVVLQPEIETLFDTLEIFLKNEKKVQEFSRNTKQFAKPNAVKMIVDSIFEKK